MNINVKFIRNAMKSMAKSRPVFHGEADFRLSLAREIYRKYKTKNKKKPLIFSEWPCRQMRIDLAIKKSFQLATACKADIAFEFKYGPKRWDGQINGVQYNLKNAPEPPVRRYNFWKDVSRLEKLVKAEMIKRGYALIFTHNKAYWEKDEGKKHKGKKYKAGFQLYEGFKVPRKLKWPAGTPCSMKKWKPKPIHLQGKYIPNWQPYFKDEEQGIEIRYLLLEITRKGVLGG